MLLSRQTPRSTALKYGMDHLCLPISNPGMALILGSDNVKDCFITLVIRISGLNLIQAKIMRTQRNAKSLKKTHRNRRRQVSNSCISRRSSFPDTNHSNLWLVQERERTYGKVFPGTIQNILQRICHSGKWSAFYSQTRKVQL